MNRTFITVLCAASAFAGAAPAVAQSYSPYGWQGSGYYQGADYNRGYDQRYDNGYNRRSPEYQRQIDRTVAETTCSGQRGEAMAHRLDMAMRDRAISPGAAQQMESELRRLRDREQHECGERDWNGAVATGKDYIRLRAWFDQETRYRYASRR